MRIGDSSFDDQGLQQVVVLSGDEVQGPAHGPGQHDRAIDQARSVHVLLSKPSGASSKCETGRRQNLGLDASQISNQINDRATSRPMEMLRSRTEAPYPIVAERFNRRHPVAM